MGAVLVTSMVVVANVTGAVMVLPQVVRLRRGGVTHGVSAAWAGVGAAMNAWWVAYGVAVGVWALIPVTAVGVVLYAVIIGHLVRINGLCVCPQVAVGVVSLGSVPLAALVIGGWSAAGVAMGVSYGVQFAPAAWTALRSERLDGLSVQTWVLAWVEAVAWFGYGIVVADPALTIGGAGGTLMSSIILGAIAVRSQPSACPATA